jgi:rod shape-determining protein MreB
MLKQAFEQAVRKLHLLFASDLAIDLGTSNTLIYAPGQGIVLNEPSVIALNRQSDQIVAIGREAKLAIGREPRSVAVIRPLKDGVVADFEAAEKMLSHFIAQSLKQRLFKPRVLICTPGDITQVERRAIDTAAYRAGASRVEVIEEPIAAAIGAGYDSRGNSTFMVVDIGGGTTDIAVLSSGGPVHLSTLRVGGTEMDEAIARYLRQRRGVEVGELTSEAIKLELGTVEPQIETRTAQVRGRSTTTGLPVTVEVTNSEIRSALVPVVEEIVAAVRGAMENLPPEVAADLLESGMVLSGGASQLPGLAGWLSRELGIEARLVQDPMATVVLGAGRLLRRLEPSVAFAREEIAEMIGGQAAAANAHTG